MTAARRAWSAARSRCSRTPCQAFVAIRVAAFFPQRALAVTYIAPRTLLRSGSVKNKINLLVREILKIAVTELYRFEILFPMVKVSLFSIDV